MLAKQKSVPKVSGLRQAIGVLLVAVTGLIVILSIDYIKLHQYNPEQGCDPRDLSGKPVDLKAAQEAGVGVTTKAKCYTTN